MLYLRTVLIGLTHSCKALLITGWVAPEHVYDDDDDDEYDDDDDDDISMKLTEIS